MGSRDARAPPACNWPKLDLVADVWVEGDGGHLCSVMLLNFNNWEHNMEEFNMEPPQKKNSLGYNAGLPCIEQWATHMQ